MSDRATFHGAKVMLFLGEQLVILRRDHAPGIAWPGRLDFPGGGREGNETALACALRETREEVGLVLSPSDLVWKYEHEGPDGRSLFFAAHQRPERVRDIRFGGEGSGWQMMMPQAYLTAPDAIPHFADILRLYLQGDRV